MKNMGWAALTLLLLACGGPKNSEQADAGDLKGKVHTVQTLVYNARQEGGQVVKDGKPDPYREVDAFPPEDRRVYDREGRLDSVTAIVDGMKYVTLYAYQGDGKKSGEQVFQNGTLLTDRRFVYQDGKLVNTVEDMYINGEKTTNEYPVDPSKVNEEDGKLVEYGETERDYVVKDSQGRVLKESSYSEMDDYLTVREYTYDGQGRLTSLIQNDEFRFAYTYSEPDAQGNWTRLVITRNETPYGIVERNITYYE